MEKAVRYELLHFVLRTKSACHVNDKSESVDLRESLLLHRRRRSRGIVGKSEFHSEMGQRDYSAGSRAARGG
jgi:hypothetical protein